MYVRNIELPRAEIIGCSRKLDDEGKGASIEFHLDDYSIAKEFTSSDKSVKIEREEKEKDPGRQNSASGYSYFISYEHEGRRHRIGLYPRSMDEKAVLDYLSSHQGHFKTDAYFRDIFGNNVKVDFASRYSSTLRISSRVKRLKVESDLYFDENENCQTLSIPYIPNKLAKKLETAENLVVEKVKYLYPSVPGIFNNAGKDYDYAISFKYHGIRDEIYLEPVKEETEKMLEYLSSNGKLLRYGNIRTGDGTSSMDIDFSLKYEMVDLYLDGKKFRR